MNKQFIMILISKAKMCFWALILMSFVFFTNIHFVDAQISGTILPKAENAQNCDGDLDLFDSNPSLIKDNEAQILGCAVKTGRISLEMLPYFIKYFSNFLLGIISLLSLLFVVIGGYFYATGSASDAKEKGKNFIKNAIIGMCISFLAWSIVNVVLRTITG